MTKYKIKYGVQMPEPCKGPGGQVRWPFSEMRKGGYFSVPINSLSLERIRSTQSSILICAKAKRKKVTTRLIRSKDKKPLEIGVWML